MEVATRRGCVKSVLGGSTYLHAWFALGGSFGEKETDLCVPMRGGEVLSLLAATSSVIMKRARSIGRFRDFYDLISI